MCKEVVDWLRDRARQRFILPAQLRQLTAASRKLEGVTIVKSAPTKRRRLNPAR